MSREQICGGDEGLVTGGKGTGAGPGAGQAAGLCQPIKPSPGHTRTHTHVAHQVANIANIIPVAVNHESSLGGKLVMETANHLSNHANSWTGHSQNAQM